GKSQPGTICIRGASAKLAHVEDSDATLWIGSARSSGGRVTFTAARELGKPLLAVVEPFGARTVHRVAAWLVKNPGNWASHCWPWLRTGGALHPGAGLPVVHGRLLRQEGRQRELEVRCQGVDK